MKLAKTALLLITLAAAATANDCEQKIEGVDAEGCDNKICITEIRDDKVFEQRCSSFNECDAGGKAQFKPISDLVEGHYKHRLYCCDADGCNRWPIRCVGGACKVKVENGRMDDGSCFWDERKKEAAKCVNKGAHGGCDEGFKDNPTFARVDSGTGGECCRGYECNQEKHADMNAHSGPTCLTGSGADVKQTETEAGACYVYYKDKVHRKKLDEGKDEENVGGKCKGTNKKMGCWKDDNTNCYHCCCNHKDKCNERLDTIAHQSSEWDNGQGDVYSKERWCPEEEATEKAKKASNLGPPLLLLLLLIFAHVA